MKPRFANVMGRVRLWVAALCCGVVMLAAARGEGTTYDQALAQAKAEKKKLVLIFTGSDWNAYSAKLEREVLNTPSFESYARAKWIAVTFDFPAQAAQDPEVKKRNRALARQYQIKSYPTTIIFNSEGKELGRLGYLAGGPDNYIAELEKFKTPKPDKKDKKEPDENQTTPTESPAAPGASPLSAPGTSTISDARSQSTAVP